MISPIRTGCANQRPSGPGGGAPGNDGPAVLANHCHARKPSEGKVTPDKTAPKHPVYVVLRWTETDVSLRL